MGLLCLQGHSPAAAQCGVGSAATQVMLAVQEGMARCVCAAGGLEQCLGLPAQLVTD